MAVKPGTITYQTEEAFCYAILAEIASRGWKLKVTARCVATLFDTSIGEVTFSVANMTGFGTHPRTALLAFCRRFAQDELSHQPRHVYEPTLHGIVKDKCLCIDDDSDGIGAAASTVLDDDIRVSLEDILKNAAAKSPFANFYDREPGEVKFPKFSYGTTKKTSHC